MAGGDRGGESETALDPAFALTALEQAPDGILVVDADGRIEWANRHLHVMLGYEPAALVGCPVEQLVPAELRASHREQRETYQHQPTLRPMGTGRELFALHADGTPLPVEISLSPVESGPRMVTVAIVRDIREHHAAERAIRSAEEALAIADERERIARDLHDTVIQQLFATGLSLEATAARTSDPEVGERLGEAVTELDATIRQVRNAIFELHAPAGEHSLRREVLELTRRAARALGFEPRVRFGGPVDSSSDAPARQALVASLQEALSNVARHAGATRTDVSVEVGDALQLVVEDDGVGFDPDVTSGSGLRNMRDRAGALAGECTIVSAAGRGTTVSWRVPIP